MYLHGARGTRGLPCSALRLSGKVPAAALGEGVFIVGRSRTKRSAARSRVIAVPEVTVRELKEWRLQSGRPADDALIIGEMSPNAMRLWGRRRLPKGVRLYDLRHSHASTLHYAAGFTLPEAARRMGHGPELHLRTYAHIIESISGTRYGSLDELIAAARAELRFRQGSVRVRGDLES